MATDLGEVARSLGQTGSELARRWATQRLSAVQGYSRILSDYGAGRLSGRAAAGAYAKLAAEEAARYPTDLIGLASDYAAAVARIAGLQVKSAAMAPGPVLDIDLSGAPGDTASREFTFENPHGVDVKVAFVAAPYFDGDKELKAAPKFDPPDFVIPAKGEQTVAVTTKLDKRYFKVGQSYTAKAAVDGFDDMVIRIHLTVIEAG